MLFKNKAKQKQGQEGRGNQELEEALESKNMMGLPWQPSD